MPPYEPKTDSKEFEIADPAREVSPRNEAVSDSADITIRLWNLDRSAAAGSVTWKTESVLVYMIADLMTASHGQLNESAQSMTAHFDTTGRALVAARRIQTAILEFLGCRPGDSLAATILIHLPPTPGGYSTGMAQGALRLAEPGQILLAEEVARAVHDMPGIELRAVPALTTGGGGQSGLAELVWASADEMARLKALLNSAQPREDSAPMGATMIVNAPLGRSATNKTALAGGATGLASAATSSRMTGDLAAGRDSSFKDLEGEPTPFLTSTRVILGGAAVVLAVVLVWIFYPSKVAKAPAPAPATQVGGAESPGNSTPQLTQPQLTPPPSAQSPSSEPAKPAVASTKPVKPVADKRGKDKSAAGTPPASEPQPVQSVEGMTQNDIPGLLQMAKSDAGSGNYEKARREYRIILQLQPSNSEAREGMRRLDVAQSVR